jgi:hypothetical protein
VAAAPLQLAPRSGGKRASAMMSNDWFDLLQWPAMAVTVIASWLVASTREGRRNVGFWLFIASNVLWVAWGAHSGAKALIALQFALAALNIRGAIKTEEG